MSDFRLFETNKKASFLSKAKDHKAKREDGAKKNISIVMLQKNIRAFMAFRRHDSPEYPLLMSTPGTVANQIYAQNFWTSQEPYPKILRLRFVKQAISALARKQDTLVNNNLEAAIIAHSRRRELTQVDYRGILRALWGKLDSQYFLSCMGFKNFKEALRAVLGNLHDLIDLAIRVQPFQVASQILILYLSTHENLSLQLQTVESEERLLKSYYNSVALLNHAIDTKQDSNAIIQLVSLLVQKLRRFYTGLVMQRYNIQRSLFESVALREEIEETLKEKPEWEEYESHLYHLCKLIPNIMESYISKESKALSYALDILVEVTKLGESVVAVNISVQDFFSLIEKLNNKPILGKQEQVNRHYQFFIVILMIEKYLQGLNDLKFSQLFRYDAERLKECIRNSVIRFVKSLVNFNNDLSIVHQIYRHSIAFLNNLYNKIFRTGLLRTTVFQDASINIFEGNYKYTNYGNASYMKQLKKIVELCPFLLPIDTRFLVFRQMVRNQPYHDHEYGNKSITIHRGREFEDAMAQLFHRNIKSRFHVRFVNQFGQEEMGMDAGGLTKELLTRLFKIAFNPSRKWFVENDRKQLLPNPDYWRLQEGNLSREFEFIGRLLGKSLHENIMLGVKFAGPFLNLLINNRNSFDDLLLIDGDLYRSLIFIVQMQQGVQDLCLTFQYHDNLTKKLINLKPHGEKIRVTRQNKMQYVNLLINYKVNRSMQRQTRSIRKGLKSVINDNWIRMFNYAEFNYLLSGTGTIDVNDWMKYANVMGQGCEMLISDFWATVYQFTEEEKSLLLKFVTSCERPSFLGFKDLRPAFTIRVMQKDDNMLPASHTCSNVLDLPFYSNKKIMREKLLYAIKSGSGFEMG